MRRTMVVALVALAGSAGGAVAPPWQRTEVREPCSSYTPLRAPYFGDLHVHTLFSADAYIFGTRGTPRQAYDFARGVGPDTLLPDENEAQTREARIDRPLDFMGVTDHAEFFGEVLLCSTPGSPVYDDALSLANGLVPFCAELRQVDANTPDEFSATIDWLSPDGQGHPKKSSDFCFLPGVDCDAAAVSVWQEEQAAADEAYDRTAACAFTSFVGYEYTASPLGRHLHRNVIFRNEHVPPFAASFLETSAGGTPQGLWSAIENDCLGAGTGCDAVIIPHNSNLSDGRQFFDPADAAEARRRQTLEPLAEIHQIKGNSECRFDRLAGAGAGTADELCTFEQMLEPFQGPISSVLPIDRYPTRNLIRNALKDGLGFENRLGVNPFRFGFTGSSDNHNAIGGAVAEIDWPGGGGGDDATPALQIAGGMRNNPGGLTAVWAEENSRDAVFDALRRRETFATSGTRPVVRFFAGDLAPVRCGAADFVRDGYRTGTAMGGEIGPVRGKRGPRFAVWAVKDPGTSTAPGTDLQRVQIVKGWVDAQGATHEQVFDVAGNAQNGADIDPATCAPRGTGSGDLCTVWQDPTFDRTQRAFYYARVLENPTCRWSTRVCKAAGVDPFASNCAAQATTAGPAYADCCLGPGNDPFIESVIQERAWTSPIWYQPDGIARLQARIKLARRPRSDQLALRLGLGRLPAGLDPATMPLTLRVADDDDIFAVSLPAGALRQRGRRLYVLSDPRGRSDGLRALSLGSSGRGEGVLKLRVAGTDLDHADRAEHMVTVTLTVGSTYRASQTRLWRLRGDRLAPEGG